MKTNSDLVLFLFDSFAEFFPISLICSFSFATLKIFTGILQNMFLSQHQILFFFAQRMLLQIHLVLSFDDFLQVFTRILDQTRPSKSKFELTLLMLVRAVQKASPSQLAGFVSSEVFSKILELSLDYESKIL